MLAVVCEEITLVPSVCLDIPVVTDILVCSPTVICGQWRVGQAVPIPDGSYTPSVCSPLDLVPLVCEEA